MSMFTFFFFSSRRRHTRFKCDWSSDVCSSDLGMRDGVKRPTQISGANVVGANVAERRGESLGVPSADYHKVFVNDGRTGQVDGLSGGRFAAQIFAEVDANFLRKRQNGFARGGVQSVKKIRHATQNALVL